MLAPFRGVFLDPTRVDLGAIICPPYDVVEPVEDARLRARSAYNVVHLVRPRAPDGTGDAYRHAADLIDAWRGDGVLQRADADALYVYEQVVDGRRLLGLVGAVRVVEAAQRSRAALSQLAPIGPCRSGLT